MPYSASESLDEEDGEDSEDESDDLEHGGDSSAAKASVQQPTKRDRLAKKRGLAAPAGVLFAAEWGNKPASELGAGAVNKTSQAHYAQYRKMVLDTFKEDHSLLSDRAIVDFWLDGVSRDAFILSMKGVMLRVCTASVTGSLTPLIHLSAAVGEIFAVRKSRSPIMPVQPPGFGFTTLLPDTLRRTLQRCDEPNPLTTSFQLKRALKDCRNRLRAKGCTPVGATPFEEHHFEAFINLHMRVRELFRGCWYG